MHDTCNSANAIARKMRVLRDDSGRNLYGEEEWRRMLGDHEREWVDFLCGNHSRNLHFDAFLRLFQTYIKANLNLIKNPLPYQYPHPNPNLPFYIGCKPNPNPNPHSNLESYIKEKLGPELEAVRVKAGGRVRVEPGGDAFIRTICKLTHIGPKQYAKGSAALCFFLSGLLLCSHVRFWFVVQCFVMFPLT